ncbi:Rhodanese-related sulfurtransferase [Frankineae bacterium MT45]|nr:Rhodanese-related sulfurtransferase [Frankineae bacterium MT45]
MHHHHQIPTVDVSEIPGDALLLDVREDFEWNAGHIDGALHVPMNQLPQRLNYEPGAITPDANIVVVCKMGGRSAQVTAWLNQQGYTATNLDGGMLAWATSGKAMISEDGTAPQVA